MITPFRLIALPVVCIIGGLGFYYARSAFDSEIPLVHVKGIEHNCWYGNEAQCSVAVTDNYKIGSVFVLLDDKTLVDEPRVQKCQYERKVDLDTSKLTPGRHTLKIIARDASRNSNKTEEERVFFVDTSPLQALLLNAESEFRVSQGKTLHMQVHSSKELDTIEAEFLLKKYPCVRESAYSNTYECFIPIDCDERPQEQLVKIILTDKVGNQVTLENRCVISASEFKKQTLAVDDAKVKEEAELGKPQAALEQELAEFYKTASPAKLWQGSFCLPMDVRGVSTEFGTLRTTQQRGRYRHNGIDYVGVPNSVIWAPQSGVVIIKDRYAISGNTVGIYHGLGVISLFFHLKDFSAINVGDTIKQGNPVGWMGKTGFAKGDHLHEERRVYNVQVEPGQWTEPNF